MTRLFARVIGLLTCLITATSCAVIGNKDLLGGLETSSDSAFGCRSTAGEYSLPKSLLKITVRENRVPNHLAKGDPTTTEIDPIQVVVQKDRPHTYCLDFLNSFTSVDSLRVDKDGSGLLKKINVNTDDQLDEAIVQVAQAIGTISERSNIRAGDAPAPQIVFTDHFDPTSKGDLDLLNDRLDTFGLCVIVLMHGRNHDRIENIVRRRCGKRLSSKRRTKLIHDNFSNQHAFKKLPAGFKNSLLYRPTATADVLIMHRPNRLVRSVWLPYEKRVETLIDNETIIGFDIKRAIFAKRATDLTFSEGVLTEVFIDKGSELAEFVQVPLSVARAVVQLPTEIIRLQIGEANKTADLIDAQSKLIAARRELEEQRRTTEESQKNLNLLSNLSVPRTLNQCLAQCEAFGNDANSCARAC